MITFEMVEKLVNKNRQLWSQIQERDEKREELRQKLELIWGICKGDPECLDPEDPTRDRLEQIMDIIAD